MSIGDLRPEELKSILVAAGFDPNHAAARDPERLRRMFELLDKAGLLRIEVTSVAIRLTLPSATESGELVLPRSVVLH